MGGRLSPPFFVEDREEPYRAEFVVWMELPEGFVVGQELHGPEGSRGALARALRDALERPLVGRPRRPARIRVAEASLADEVREVLGAEVPIEIAPTPELDLLLDSMLESMPPNASDGRASYLERGRVPLERVAELFRNAELLYRAAPWEVSLDHQILRMDIPALGVEGACVSIIGHLGQSLGVLVFPSLAGYEAFARLAEAPRPEGRRIDLGTSVLSLTFERGAELPASMRREVARHGWPVASASAYPRVERRDRDGASRPLVERDVRIASACALSLTSFLAQHRALFRAERLEPVCVSYTDENEITVRFTLPYQAFPLFDVSDPPARGEGPSRSTAKVGRNDPCPCGSGKKYKKCHLPSDEAQRGPGAGRSSIHDLDERLVGELSRFAAGAFGPEWGRFREDFADAAQAVQLALPWAVYGFRVQGQTVVDRYLEERGRRLSPAERGWLEAQRRAWLSVWEVIDVEPGRSVTLRDLLSNEARRVREVSGSETLVARDAILGRVVDHQGDSVLCGVHPRPLPPFEAAEVVRRARGRLRRKGVISAERLRDDSIGRYLIRRWEKEVGGLDRRLQIPPELRNTDGEAFLLTTDHFDLAPGARAEVAARLAALEGVEAPDPGDDSAGYVFLRAGNPMHASWENTVIGQARLSEASLRLETNSRGRADVLRRRVEEACPGLIRHCVREHADPLSRGREVRAGRPTGPPESTPPEALELLREFKERHYAGWADEPLPALGGRSPREAVRTAQGRGAVDVLLKEMENRERRFDGPGGFDFSRLRRELGIE